jgi:sulfur carrier protein
MIEVIVNGERVQIPERLNIKETIEALDYRKKGFAVALNGTFVPIAKYEDTIVQDSDSIEILAPVQGG